MKILVTGAAGFVGSHLCERLAKMGHDVIGIDCFTDYYARHLKEMNVADIKKAGVTFIEADLATTPLDPILNGVEVIYHLAGQPGIVAHVTLAAYTRNNLLAIHKLLEAAKKVPTLKLFVNTATSSCYGHHATDEENVAAKPVSYYGVTKLAAEQLALAYHRNGNLPACSLRLFSVFGPRERPEKLYPRLIGALLTDGQVPLYEGSLQHLRSFTYVHDALDGFIAALDNIDKMPGEIFNIGSDKQMSTKEAIEMVESLIGKKTRFKHMPPRPGDQKVTHANIDKARRILGYEPKTAHIDGFAAEIEWYKKRILK